MLTARAKGVLEELALNGSRGAAKALSEGLGEGRDAIQAALTELREVGYIETETQKIRGRIISQINITATGYQFLESRTQLLLNRLNSTYIHIANSFNSKPNNDSRIVNVSEGNEKMEWIDPDDLPGVIEKHNKRKHKEKIEAKEKLHSDRMQKRNGNPALWSVTDSAFEFAAQMHNVFHIAPWSMTQSEFRFALSNKRDEYGTKGDTEKIMFELFFDSIRHDTRYSNPNIIWKMFIKRFNVLLEAANSAMLDEEALIIEKNKAAKSREWLDDVQD